ncbi:MAG: helix-turn-helix domain-containing protein [Clostridia bacterium]|nr:helix-turn-helix domain-containing protein [Clostridia bacterium]
MKIYSKDQWIERDHSVNVFRCVYTQEVAVHTHDFIEIVYIRSGSAIETVNGVDYAVKRGDLLFLNYGTEHAFKPTDELTYINVSFYPETVGKSIISDENAFGVLTLTAFNELLETEGNGLISFYGTARNEIESLLNDMIKEQENDLMLREMAMKHYMGLLLLKIVRRMSGEVDNSDLWPDIARYIEDNLDGDLSLQTLSTKCFYNPAYFSRIFRERYSVTLSEYVMQKRVEKAKTLLLTTDYPISKISEMVGFTNKSFFYRKFFKYYQKTPSQFRGKKK